MLRSTVHRIRGVSSLGPCSTILMTTPSPATASGTPPMWWMQFDGMESPFNRHETVEPNRMSRRFSDMAIRSRIATVNREACGWFRDPMWPQFLAHLASWTLPPEPNGR